MSGPGLIYLYLISRAAAVFARHVRTRPIAGGLGDNGLPDPPGS
jgi:hypothetical protein